MKKVFKYIPIALAIILILALTLMNTPRNVEMSEQFRGLLVKGFSKLGMSAEGAWWNSSSGVRKLGHVIEYGLLGIGSAIAVEKKRWAILICVGVSMLDQAVKVLVPIRHFDWTDIPFDIIGAVIGILLVTVIQRVVKS